MSHILRTAEKKSTRSAINTLVSLELRFGRYPSRRSRITTAPVGEIEQVILGRFEPVVTRFGPWKIPKCLELELKMGRFETNNGSKMGQKRIFPKVIMDRSDAQTSGGGLHEIGKGSVRAAIASERYLSDVEVQLHNMHMHDQVFITNNDEHVEEIAMKQ